MVVRLLQGMFNQRPPAPRYQEIWDVGLVVKFIQDGQPTVNLSLKELSKRTVTLLALCNAGRASDIQALDIRFIRSTGDSMVFTIPGLTKTRRSGPPKEVTFSTFKQVESLCPVKTVQMYMQRTTLLRINSESEVSQLIISYKKPHKPVKACSISRWIKETLSDAGVDTAIFKGHSTRAASTSAASVKGVSVNDIMAMAGWSRSSTFKRFYHRHITNDFTRSILQS